MKCNAALNIDCVNRTDDFESKYHKDKRENLISQAGREKIPKLDTSDYHSALLWVVFLSQASTEHA